MSQNPPELPSSDPTPDPFDDFINRELDFGADKPSPLRPPGFGGPSPVVPSLPTSDFDFDDLIEDDDEPTDLGPSRFGTPFSGPGVPRYSRLPSQMPPSRPPFGTGSTPFQRASSPPGSTPPPRTPLRFGGFQGRPVPSAQPANWWRDRVLLLELCLFLIAISIIILDLIFPDISFLPSERKLIELESTVQAQTIQIQQLQATLAAVDAK